MMEGEDGLDGPRMQCVSSDDRTAGRTFGPARYHGPALARTPRAGPARALITPSVFCQAARPRVPPNLNAQGGGKAGRGRGSAHGFGADGAPSRSATRSPGTPSPLRPPRPLGGGSRKGWTGRGRGSSGRARSRGGAWC
jgi:hypothetical protein